MNATQKYELIRPILKHEKNPKQVSAETGFSLSTIYRYLKRLRASDGDIESVFKENYGYDFDPALWDLTAKTFLQKLDKMLS